MKKEWWKEFQLNKKINLWFPTYFRVIALTVITALSIGMLFGFISLKLAQTTEEPIGKKEEQSSEEPTANSEKLEEMTFYIVQAGTFSDMENAEALIEKLKNKNEPAIKWETKEYIYVFSGIATDKNGAEKIAEKRKDNDIPVYVKEWSVMGKELSLNTEESSFIHQFIKVWKSTLVNGDIANDKLKEMKPREVSDELKLMYESIYTLTTDDSVQQWLLETIYQYDALE